MVLVVTICYLDRPELVVVGFILAMDTEGGGICVKEMGATCRSTVRVPTVSST